MANLIRLPELNDLAFIDEQVEYISPIGIEYARSNTWDRYYFRIGLKTGKHLHIILGSDFDWEISQYTTKKEHRDKALNIITTLRSSIIDLIPVQNIHSIRLTLD
jgi:hypothetical protein